MNTLKKALLAAYRSIPSSRLKAKASNALKKRAQRRNVFAVEHGLLMDLDIWEWTQNQLSRVGAIEPLTTSRYAFLLRPGDVYVDVGAHVGFHTLIARRLIQETGMVVAVEPLPYNCAKVLTNWSLNGFQNLSLFPVAAGSQERIALIRDQPPSDRSRLSLAAPSVSGDQPQEVCVPTLRLNQILEVKKIQRVALLKIDAEGLELEVIRGLGEAIGGCQAIVVEVCEPMRDEAVRLVELLKVRGFDLRTVEDRSWDGRSILPENNLLAVRAPSRD
jgi:FkbM family methyltransferase